MQVRHGACDACGARYKLSAAFAHDRAKCKQCGGVVVIGPPVDEGAPPAGAPPVPASHAARPARPPAAGAPARTAPVSSSRPEAKLPAAPMRAERRAPEPNAGASSKPPTAPAGPHSGDSRARPAVGRGHPMDAARKSAAGRRAAAGAAPRSSRHGAGEDEQPGGEEPRRGRAKQGLPISLIAGGAVVVLAGLVFLFKDALFGGGSAEAGGGESVAASDADAQKAGWPLEEQSLKTKQRGEILWTEGKDPLIGAIVAGLAAENLTIAREPVHAYVDMLSDGWLKEEGDSHLRTRDRLIQAAQPANLAPHLAWGREYLAQRLAEHEAKRAEAAAKMSDPTAVDLESMEDFPRFAGTTDAEWEQLNADLDVLFDAYAPRKQFTEARARLLGMYRKAFPPLMNRWKAMDLAVMDSVKAGLELNRFLEQATGGTKSTGWKDGVEPEDQTFNKGAIRSWFKALRQVLSDDSQWAGMLRVDLDKIPDPAGLGAPPPGLDAALEELDVD